MDAKSLAIKTAQAHQRVINAAEQIADHFGFTEEMTAIRNNIFTVKQAHLVAMLQSELIADLLDKVAEHLVSIEPEPVDDKPKASHTDKRK